MDTAAQGLRDRRRDDIDRVLADAAARHRAVGAALAGLRVRLAAVHSHCEHVDDRAWADYRARLDAGLDELHAELARAGTDADALDGAEPGELVFPRVTRLELDGWRVRLAALADHRAPAPEGAPLEPLVAYVEHELDSYLRSDGATRERREDIHQMLDTMAVRARERSS